MRRRTFLRATGGVAATTAATAALPGGVAGFRSGANPAVVIQDGGTVTVTVGPNGSLVFEPGTSELLAITPGTTVEFVWDSDLHNIVVENQPGGANWEGTAGGPGDYYDTGHTYSHTFQTVGTYDYYCAPHRAQGMEATLVVTSDPGAVTPSGTATPGGNATATATPAMNGTATGTPGGGGGGETHTVDMTDQLVFDPDSLTVAPGDTVVWENVGTIGHSVTAYEADIPEGAEYWASGGFDSEQAARDAYSASGSLSATGNVPGGESWSHTFETEGVHEYFCKPHEGVGMIGQIEVSADAGGGEGGSAPSIPDSAKVIGVATTVAMVTTLGLAFTLLKYGGGSGEE